MVEDHRHRYDFPVGKPGYWSQLNEVGNREHYRSQLYRCSVKGCVEEKTLDECVEITRDTQTARCAACRGR